MIQSIEIKNFKYFHHTTAKGFGRINLFGGKNNSGKTVLLEALYLMGEPHKNTILDLFKTRRIDLKGLKGEPILKTA